MRVLLVASGAATAIRDVEDGYRAALRDELGPQLLFYDLTSRITLAQRWLLKLWRSKGADPEQKPTWPEAIYRAGIEALEMALRYDVDWVFAISGMFLHPDVLGLMRRAGLKTAVLFTESPYEDEPQLRMVNLVDLAWTTERTSVDVLRAVNPEVHYLRHAYDPVRHNPCLPAGLDVPAHDVVFVGTGFLERIEILEALDWRGIDLGLYGAWTLLPSRHKLRRYVRGGPVDNTTTAQLYRRAKIGLNLFRTSRKYGRNTPRVEHAESLNPRAYELAACGVFQVTDDRPEVHQTFGTMVKTFGSPGELERMIRFYLDDPGARWRAQTGALARVASHTFAARAAQVLADLESFDNRQSYSDAVGTPAFAGLKGA